VRRYENIRRYFYTREHRKIEPIYERKFIQKMTEDYIPELYSLIIVGTILLISKIIACCFSLGLYQKHRQVGSRRDSLSLAKINGLKIEKIALENLDLERAVCNCSRISQLTQVPQNRQRSQSLVVPKLEIENPCVPASKVLPKHLVRVMFTEAEEC
jgi:hypothetical protein